MIPIYERPYSAKLPPTLCFVGTLRRAGDRSRHKAGGASASLTRTRDDRVSGFLMFREVA